MRYGRYLVEAIGLMAETGSSRRPRLKSLASPREWREGFRAAFDEEQAGINARSVH